MWGKEFEGLCSTYTQADRAVLSRTCRVFSHSSREKEKLGGWYKEFLVPLLENAL